MSQKTCDFCRGELDPTSDYRHAHKGCFDQFQQDRASDYLLMEEMREEG